MKNKTRGRSTETCKMDGTVGLKSVAVVLFVVVALGAAHLAMFSNHVSMGAQ